MELHVLGCHGGETPKHRTSAFVLDDTLAIDAGALTSGLTVRAQSRLEACLVSHAHFDHIRDLATLSDNRCQNGCEPLVVAGSRATLSALKKHFFNDLVWPDFAKIPSEAHPTIRYLELSPERPTEIAGRIVRAVPVDHTIDSSAFIIEEPARTRRSKGPKGRETAPRDVIVYSGDTGPTGRLWELLEDVPNIHAVLMEVSFPNAQQKLATVSGHHTPQTLAAELVKFPRARDVPFFLYHIKPSFQREVERECAKIRGADLHVLKIGDELKL